MDVFRHCFGAFLDHDHTPYLICQLVFRQLKTAYCFRLWPKAQRERIETTLPDLDWAAGQST
jgi:hypothetical protein